MLASLLLLSLWDTTIIRVRDGWRWRVSSILGRDKKFSFLHRVQTDCEAYQVRYSMGTVSFILGRTTWNGPAIRFRVMYGLVAIGIMPPVQYAPLWSGAESAWGQIYRIKIIVGISMCRLTSKFSR